MGGSDLISNIQIHVCVCVGGGGPPNKHGGSDLQQNGLEIGCGVCVCGWGVCGNLLSTKYWLVSDNL